MCFSYVEALHAPVLYMFSCAFFFSHSLLICSFVSFSSFPPVLHRYLLFYNDSINSRPAGCPSCLFLMSIFASIGGKGNGTCARLDHRCPPIFSRRSELCVSGCQCEKDKIFILSTNCSFSSDSWHHFLHIERCVSNVPICFFNKFSTKSDEYFFSPFCWSHWEEFRLWFWFFTIIKYHYQRTFHYSSSRALC